MIAVRSLGLNYKACNQPIPNSTSRLVVLSKIKSLMPALMGTSDLKEDRQWIGSQHQMGHLWREVPEKCSVTQIRSSLLLADSLIQVPKVSLTFSTWAGFPMEVIVDSVRGKPSYNLPDGYDKKGIQL